MPSIAQGNEPSAPALLAAMASALPCTPAMGAWINGSRVPRSCWRMAVIWWSAMRGESMAGSRHSPATRASRLDQLQIARRDAREHTLLLRRRQAVHPFEQATEHRAVFVEHRV